MTSSKLITRTVVVALALCFVLSVAMLPTAQAGYGEVRKFLRNPPKGLDQAKIWDVYVDSIFNQPGRVLSFFNLLTGDTWEDPPGTPAPIVNQIDSTDSIIVGIMGFGTDPWITDHKTAREEYEAWEVRTFIDDIEIEMDKTPMRFFRWKDKDTGETGFGWEWRTGATFKPGEFKELLGGLGTYHFRQEFYYNSELVFDTDWYGLPFNFELV